MRGCGCAAADGDDAGEEESTALPALLPGGSLRLKPSKPSSLREVEREDGAWHVPSLPPPPPTTMRSAPLLRAALRVREARGGEEKGEALPPPPPPLLLLAEGEERGVRRRLRGGGGRAPAPVPVPPPSVGTAAKDGEVEASDSVEGAGEGGRGGALACCAGCWGCWGCCSASTPCSASQGEARACEMVSLDCALGCRRPYTSLRASSDTVQGRR